MNISKTKKIKEKMSSLLNVDAPEFRPSSSFVKDLPIIYIENWANEVEREERETKRKLNSSMRKKEYDLPNDLDFLYNPNTWKNDYTH